MTDARVQVLTAGGLANAALIVEAADKAGMPLEIVAALIQKESGGRNVYGHDTGGVFSVPGRDIEVTQENYKEFLRRVLAGEKSNGGTRLALGRYCRRGRVRNQMRAARATRPDRPWK